MQSYDKQDILIAFTDDAERRILARKLKTSLIKRSGAKTSKIKLAGNNEQVLKREDKDTPVFKTVEDFLNYLHEWKAGQQTIDIAIFDNDLSNLGGKLWGIDAMILMSKTGEELQIELNSVQQEEGSTIFSVDDLARIKDQGINYATVLTNLIGIHQQREIDNLPIIKIIAFTDLKGAPREKAVILGQLVQSGKLLDSQKDASKVVTLILEDPNYVSAKNLKINTRKNKRKQIGTEEEPPAANPTITPPVKVKAKKTKQELETKEQQPQKQSESAREGLQVLIPLPPPLLRSVSDGVKVKSEVTSEGTDENKVDVGVWIPSSTTSPSDTTSSPSSTTSPSDTTSSPSNTRTSPSNDNLGSLLGNFSITTTPTFSPNKMETGSPKKEEPVTNKEQGEQQQDTNKNTR